jgi:peptide/nickel transport system substrate-binding protein
LTEDQIRQDIERVRSGALPRRSFVQGLGALGISAPMAGLLLLDAGLAQSADAPKTTPTQAGGGGLLKMLLWQGPTLLNPHFATGTKDLEAARMFYEPLVHWNADGSMLPVLAAELPSRENGGVAADGKSVVWKLKPGVLWHDGKPFTADDVVFTMAYCADPATASRAIGAVQGLRVEKIDGLSVRVVFDRPTPFWPGTYSTLQIIPKHLFAAYMGAQSREAPVNLKPVGTGPYTFVDFKPGDLVRADRNTHYHRPGRPHFDRIEMKGGGDAISAARAVLQTAEFDYAWNLQVEDEVLARLEAAGKGQLQYLNGGSAETIYLNTTDPVAALDGERANPKSRHPVLSDPVVRKALGLLIDRQAVQKYIYGRAGVATANFLHNPPKYRSPNTSMEFSTDKAAALLEAAGWKQGADGVRSKNGRALRFVFQTTSNPLRQKTQGIVKQAAQKAGIDIELKSVSGSVFFSSDVGNPDTAGKFWADIQMYTADQGTPDPQRHMQRFVSWEASSKANKWSGLNVARWRNADYDAAFKAAETELDPVKRTALFIRMNDLVCGDGFIVPLVYRPTVAALRKGIVAELSGWSEELGSLADWVRKV